MIAINDNDDNNENHNNDDNNDDTTTIMIDNLDLELSKMLQFPDML